MNCLQEGHMSKFCKTQVMCPYCAENHQADTCPQKARTTSNCTACARRMKTYNPLLDLPQLFSTTPLILCHSPLDPICPARIALVFEKAKLATEPRQQTQVADSNCTPPPPAEVSVSTGQGVKTNNSPTQCEPNNSTLQAGAQTVAANENTIMDVSQ